MYNPKGAPDESAIMNDLSLELRDATRLAFLLPLRAVHCAGTA